MIRMYITTYNKITIPHARSEPQTTDRFVMGADARVHATTNIPARLNVAPEEMSI
jgi:hypothetical protein